MVAAIERLAVSPPFGRGRALATRGRGPSLPSPAVSARRASVADRNRHVSARSRAALDVIGDSIGVNPGGAFDSGL